VKKNELKKLIKPVVKECIHEVLLESGLLTNIVSEVAQGMSQNVIVENKQKQSDALFNENVNLFENTEPLTNRVATSSGPKPGAVDLGDPDDAGVDISSLIGGASQVWKAMK
jgi:hypothetical protein